MHTILILLAQSLRAGQHVEQVPAQEFYGETDFVAPIFCTEDQIPSEQHMLTTVYSHPLVTTH